LKAKPLDVEILSVQDVVKEHFYPTMENGGLVENVEIDITRELMEKGFLD